VKKPNDAVAAATALSISAKRLGQLRSFVGSDCAQGDVKKATAGLRGARLRVLQKHCGRRMLHQRVHVSLGKGVPTDSCRLPNRRYCTVRAIVVERVVAVMPLLDCPMTLIV